MAKKLTIHPIRSEEEIRTAADLAGEIWHEHFTPIIGADQVEYMLQTMQSFGPMARQIAQGYEYFLLEEEGQPIGYSAIRPEAEALFLSKLYLRRSARGNGYASQVLDYYIQLCRERGLRKIRLTCNRFNTGTLAVYQHLGFDPVREEKADIGSGYVMDDFIMEKQLG